MPLQRIARQLTCNDSCSVNASPQNATPSNATQRGNARARPNKKRPSICRWSGTYLRVLAETGQKVKAAQIASVERSTVWRRRTQDAEFARRENEALEIARDAYQSEAIRRAVEGTVDEHFDRDGKIVSRKRTYSDTILLRLLGRLDPTWREKQQIEIRDGAHATRAERLAALEAERARIAAHSRS